MISWNADNSAFEMGSLQLQLAPTLKQQASAMMTILDRYSWKTFSIVTGKIAGHHHFEIVSSVSNWGSISITKRPKSGILTYTKFDADSTVCAIFQKTATTYLCSNTLFTPLKK